MQSSTAGGYVDFSRFGALRQQAATDQRAAMETVADEFEALFVDLMLKAAREAEIEGGLFESGAMSTYREMFDNQIAMTLAHNHDLGIGRALTRQLDGMMEDPAPRPQAQPAAMSAAAVAATAAWRRYNGPPPRSGAGGDVREQFRNRLAPHAAEAGAALGVAPRAILAQAALESGWGQHVIPRADGTSSHNYFGIKAGAGWHGEVVSVPTTEYIAGRAVTIEASFRAYDTPAAAFRDYVEFIGDNPRYGEVRDNGADAERFARQLAAAGYATDPKYAEKIIAIIETGALGGEQRTRAGL